MTDGGAIAEKFAANGRNHLPRAGLLHRLRREPLFPRKSSGGGALTAVIGVMAFLACLSLSGLILIQAATEKWTNDLQSGLTVQIKGPDADAIRADTAAVARAIADIDGVVSVKALSPEESAKLLEPWLGKGNVAAYLNVPGLVEVTVAPRLRKDLAPLRQAVAKVAPGAEIDDHSAWHQRLSAAARSGEIAAGAVFAVIMAAACAIAVFAARAGLSANRDVVSLLHLVGATDQFVANEVQRRFFAIGLQGALAGYVAAAALLSLLAAALHAARGLLPDVRLDWTAWAILFSAPLILCLATAISARFAVLKSLAQEL